MPRRDRQSRRHRPDVGRHPICQISRADVVVTHTRQHGPLSIGTFKDGLSAVRHRCRSATPYRRSTPHRAPRQCATVSRTVDNVQCRHQSTQRAWLAINWTPARQAFADTASLGVEPSHRSGRIGENIIPSYTRRAHRAAGTRLLDEQHRGYCCSNTTPRAARPAIRGSAPFRRMGHVNRMWRRMSANVMNRSASIAASII